MEQTLIKMKTWLAEKNVRVTEIKGDIMAFHLEVMPKSNNDALPLHIFGTNETDEKILVCWNWGIFEEDRKTLKMIHDDVKRSFEKDVKLGFQVMNLPIIFNDSILDLESIYTEKTIRIDELTKESLFNTMGLLIKALEFASKKFVDHFSMPVQFDPSSHV